MANITHWVIESATGPGTALTLSDVLSLFEHLEFVTEARGNCVVAWESDDDRITDGSGDDHCVALAIPAYEQVRGW